MDTYFSILVISLCILAICAYTIHSAKTNEDKWVTTISMVALILFSMTVGGIIKGYDFDNECTYKERAETQTRLHGLAMQMLNMYFEADPNFFLDVISETDAYGEYNTEVEGDWEGFGLK